MGMGMGIGCMGMGIDCIGTGTLPWGHTRDALSALGQLSEAAQV